MPTCGQPGKREGPSLAMTVMYVHGYFWKVGKNKFFLYVTERPL